MNKERQRIKIAEACGWKPDDDGAGLNTWEASWVGPRLYGLRPSRRSDGTVASYTVDCLVPDYPSDLNAMHEAEMALSEDDLKSYRAWLVVVCRRHLWHANATERAEAFLRTLNLWEDEP